jgi:thioredoxin-related protein
MKKLLFPTMLVVSLFCSGISVAAEKIESVNWHTNFDKALAESKQAKKPIFIDFYGEGCSLCAYFDRTTAQDPDFIKESRSWVMVKINPEKNVKDARLAHKYKVAGFPTLVFVDSKGKLLDSATEIPTTSWKVWLAPKLSKAKQKFR